jgi:hypothetical protein
MTNKIQADMDKMINKAKAFKVADDYNQMICNMSVGQEIDLGDISPAAAGYIGMNLYHKRLSKSFSDRRYSLTTITMCSRVIGDSAKSNRSTRVVLKRLEDSKEPRS